MITHRNNGDGQPMCGHRKIGEMPALANDLSEVDCFSCRSLYGDADPVALPIDDGETRDIVLTRNQQKIYSLESEVLHLLRKNAMLQDDLESVNRGAYGYVCALVKLQGGEVFIPEKYFREDYELRISDDDANGGKVLNVTIAKVDSDD